MKISFLKFFKKHARIVKLSDKASIINPSRDWYFILVFTFLLLVASAIAHYIFYLSASMIEVPTDVTSPGPSLKRAQLEKIVGQLRDQRAVHERLLATPPSVIDPS